MNESFSPFVDFLDPDLYIDISMKLSKRFVFMMLPLVCAGFLQAQSLTELAKKEKERRAKLKGKKSVVITNEDLRKMDFKPGLTSRPLLQEERSAAGTPPSSQPVKSKTPSAAQADQRSDKRDRGDPTPPPVVSELEEEWKRANDTVGFLNLKLGGLWQQYYSGAAVSIDLLQAKIGMTYLELQEAQKNAEKLKRELETAKKRKSP